MVRSMTGYGEASITAGDTEVKVEIISLNSRYLDIFTSIPEGLEYLEPLIRSWTAKKISRGRLRVKIHVTQKPTKLDLDYPVVRKSLQETLKQLKGFPKVAKTLDLAVLFTVPEFRTPREAPKIPQKSFEKVYRQALDQLVQSRTEEGKRIEMDLRKRINLIRKALKEIRKLKEKEVEDRKQKVQEALAELEDLNNDLVAQNLISVVMKSDITEEVVRLESHIQRFRETLRVQPPIGKRLEFLAQEMHREATTISQKSTTPEIIDLTIRIREEIEKIKEQLRNVE